MPPSGPESGPLCRYLVTVRTSDVPRAGTDGNVSIHLVGKPRGRDGQNQLHQRLANSTGRNLFERGQEDSFVLECSDLGDLEAIALEVAPSAASAFTGKLAWHLETLSLESLGAADARTVSRRWRFGCDAFFTGGSRKAWSRTLGPSGLTLIEDWDSGPGPPPAGGSPLSRRGSSPAPGADSSRCYKVIVRTAPEAGAATDSHVFLKLTGTDYERACHPTWYQELAKEERGRRNLFESGQMDEFILRDAPDLGPLKRVALSVRAGTAAGWTGKRAWRLLSLTVTEPARGAATTGRAFVFRGGWFAAGRAERAWDRVDGSLGLELESTTPDESMTGAVGGAGAEGLGGEDDVDGPLGRGLLPRRGRGRPKPKGLATIAESPEAEAAASRQAEREEREEREEWAARGGAWGEQQRSPSPAVPPASSPSSAAGGSNEASPSAGVITPAPYPPSSGRRSGPSNPAPGHGATPGAPSPAPGPNWHPPTSGATLRAEWSSGGTVLSPAIDSPTEKTEAAPPHSWGGTARATDYPPPAPTVATAPHPTGSSVLRTPLPPIGVPVVTPAKPGPTAPARPAAALLSSRPGAPPSHVLAVLDLKGGCIMARAYGATAGVAGSGGGGVAITLPPAALSSLTAAAAAAASAGYRLCRLSTATARVVVTTPGQEGLRLMLATTDSSPRVGAMREALAAARGALALCVGPRGMAQLGGGVGGSPGDGDPPLRAARAALRGASHLMDWAMGAVWAADGAGRPRGNPALPAVLPLPTAVAAALGPSLASAAAAASGGDGAPAALLGGGLSAVSTAEWTALPPAVQSLLAALAGLQPAGGPPASLRVHLPGGPSRLAIVGLPGGGGGGGRWAVALLLPAGEDPPLDYATAALAAGFSGSVATAALAVADGCLAAGVPPTLPADEPGLMCCTYDDFGDPGASCSHRGGGAGADAAAAALAEFAAGAGAALPVSRRRGGDRSPECESLYACHIVEVQAVVRGWRCVGAAAGATRHVMAVCAPGTGQEAAAAAARRLLAAFAAHLRP